MILKVVINLRPQNSNRVLYPSPFLYLHPMSPILPNLTRPTRTCLLIILALQTIIFFYFLLTIPFHYDEAWTYLYFTRKGFYTTLTFYPIPNNHILYNLVAGVFDILPLSPEITTRLPSYFASLVATWYFFKIAQLYFTDFTALITTALFASAYPVVLYSIEARGYGFVVCFTVLLLYAALRLIREPDSRRYRNLYIFSLVAGMYSMPSFLYGAIVISGTLFFHHLIKKQALKPFLIDHLLASVLVLLLYAPIIHFNGTEKLTQPGGFNRVTTTELTKLLPILMPAVLHFLTGTNKTSLLLLVLLIPIGIWFTRISREDSRFLVITSLVLLISPVAILYINPVLPYARTWVYLIIPLVLLVGCLITILTHYLPFRKYPFALTSCLILLLSIAGYRNFQSLHKEQFAIDYSILSTFQKIKDNIDQIKSIGYTGASLEFYAAEDLQFQCIKRKPHVSPKMDNKTAITYSEDVLVLAPDPLRHLDQYEAIGTDGRNYTLYRHK